jgi:ABC-2 type transport system permease protein
MNNTIRIYATEARFEFIRTLRMPAFAVPSLLFPAMFYLLFGVLMANKKGGAEISTYLLATYLIFGAMGPGLFGFGVGVAVERDRGWLKWRRAVPSLPGAYFISKMLMAMGFAFIIFLELALIAVTLGGVQLALSQWLMLMLITLFAALPFCALGLVIGTWVGGQAAPAIVNFIYLPMAFLSGLWIPLSALPKVVATAAPVWPSYHAAQIALKIVGADSGVPLWQHLVYLAVFTAAMLYAALLLWSRMKLK